MPTLSPGAVVALMHQAGFPSSEWARGTAIAFGESSFRTDVINSIQCKGLWQIHPVHSALLATHDWRNPLDNTRMAYNIWSNAGRSWRPWEAYTAGTFQRHMSLGEEGVNEHRMRHMELGEDPNGAPSRADQTLSGQIGVGNVKTEPADDSVSGAVARMAQAVQMLMRSETWFRVGMVAGGAILLLVGAYQLAMSIPAVRGAVNTAVKGAKVAVTKGKL